MTLCPSCREPAPSHTPFCPHQPGESGFSNGVTEETSVEIGHQGPRVPAPPAAAPEGLEDSAGDKALDATALLTGQQIPSFKQGTLPAGARTVKGRPGDLKEGTMVGEYRTTGLIGRGGMGAVYSGVHPVIGKRVAIKVLQAALAVEPSGLERFQREAQSVNRIGHPSVVDVFAFGQLVGGTPYLVMEFLSGQNLGDRLKQGAISFEEIRDIFGQLLSGLQAAHEVGVVHRDLKPDNLMLVPMHRSGLQVKILDFGIAKLMADDQGPQLTRSGMALGTPAYMSPEQAMGRGVGPATDLYSTAVMLYLACTGRPPFTAASSFEVQRKHVSQPPDPPSHLCEMPAELEALILRGLAKSPQDRFGSAADMAQALSAVPSFDLRPRFGPGGDPDVSQPSQQVVPGPPHGPPHGTPATPSLQISNPLLQRISLTHRRKLVAVLCPPEMGQCPESLRWVGETLEDGLFTRLCEVAEVNVVRPSGQLLTTGGGTRARGEMTAQRSHADLYIEITLQVAGTNSSSDNNASVRANLRIGAADHAPEETPFSARASGTVGDLFALEDKLIEAACPELKQRARSNMMRVNLVGGPATQPAQQALQQAEAAYSSPWDNVGVIETVARWADQALQLDPEYAEAYYRRGTARIWLGYTASVAGDGQVEAAIADLREAQRRLPQLAGSAVFLALGQALCGQFGAALEEIERMATLEVTPAVQRSAEANVCDLCLAWPRVLATVMADDALVGDQGLPLLALGRVLAATGRLSEAEQVARRLLPIYEADTQATRTGQRRSMRSLPLYGPALLLGATLLLQGRNDEAWDVLREARGRLAGCEHVTAPPHQLIGLRLLREAGRRRGKGAQAQEAETAEGVLTRRLLGDREDVVAQRAGRMLGIYWMPLCHVMPMAPAAAPWWRHMLTARFAVRNRDLPLARTALSAMEAARDDRTRADTALLRAHIEAIAEL